MADRDPNVALSSFSKIGTFLPIFPNTNQSFLRKGCDQSSFVPHIYQSIVLNQCRIRQLITMRSCDSSGTPTGGRFRINQQPFGGIKFTMKINRVIKTDGHRKYITVWFSNRSDQLHVRHVTQYLILLCSGQCCFGFNLREASL